MLKMWRLVINQLRLIMHIWYIILVCKQSHVVQLGIVRKARYFWIAVWLLVELRYPLLVLLILCRVLPVFLGLLLFLLFSSALFSKGNKCIDFGEVIDIVQAMQIVLFVTQRTYYLASTPVIFLAILVFDTILTKVVSTQVKKPRYNIFWIPYTKAYGAFKFIHRLILSTLSYFLFYY